MVVGLGPRPEATRTKTASGTPVGTSALGIALGSLILALGAIAALLGIALRLATFRSAYALMGSGGPQRARRFS